MWRRRGTRAVLVGCMASFHFLFPSLEGWAADDLTKVAEIEIQGNKHIETEAIAAKIMTRVGDSIHTEELRKDLQAIYKMGYFKDIQIQTEFVPDGTKVIFIVTERPFLVDVHYAGHEDIQVEKLKELVNLKTQTFVDDFQIKENAERIRQYYEQEGYYQTQVIPVLKDLGEERMSLTYYVKEGMKARIRRIEFDGAHAISEKKIIKAIETGKYSSLTSWLTSSGFYKEEVLNFDVERIREVYLDNGYLEVQVGSPEVELVDSRTQVKVSFPVAHGDIDTTYEFREVSATIRIPLVEGKQYRIRKIEVKGNDVLETSEVMSSLDFIEGDIFARNKLRSGVARIQDIYGAKGYLYTNVIPQFQTHPEDLTVDLVLQVTENPQIRIRHIRISGNEKTRDKVIRREIRLNEQEIINTKLLRRSFQRINNLNFFDSIDITPQRIGDSEVDLWVRVKEKSTGAMSVGGGYSSVDRIVGLVEITQGNLFGRGQLLRLRGQLGGISSTYSLTFREPYLFDRPISATVDLFKTQRDFDSYKDQRTGGDLVLGKALSEFVNGSIRYKLESLELFDLSDEAPDLIEEQEGKSLTSSLRATLTRDTRDFFFDPREGTRLSGSVEYAGTILGGGNDFIKTILDASHFFPLAWGTVFSLHGRVGYAAGIQGDELPIGERFFVGGINTVRGVDFGEAGPCKRDVVGGEKFVSCKDGEIIGGERELIFNAEFLFPLVQEARIKGLMFFDAGRSFDDEETIRIEDLRTSIGFGLRWISPIGPLRLEWGYPLDRESGEESSQLEFSIGTLF